MAVRLVPVKRAVTTPATMGVATMVATVENHIDRMAALGTQTALVAMGANWITMGILSGMTAKVAP
jgi:hypothetical protein